MENEIISGLDSYLSFRLGNEKFVVNIGYVKQILEMTTITKVPHMPDYYKGVINLFGDVLPVIDSRVKFNLEEKPYGKSTCIIVLMISNQDVTAKFGLIVDEVRAVLQIADEQIKEPPEIGGKFKNELIHSIANVDGEFIIILNVDDIFSTDEITLVNPNQP
ncbi:chemotaxis protein CheW [Sunxiuqinia indica]|uniref:chemotaxis protein CheW n=1 Tax=Sunxiuqinia indica TaxID=2692584 RepID=UPI001356FAB1|nr:chemotaxis protein CheW [Sunxiuqinia indica]